MVTAIAIPFGNFKDKVRLTKEWSSKAKVEIMDEESLIYIIYKGDIDNE